MMFQKYSYLFVAEVVANDLLEMFQLVTASPVSSHIEYALEQSLVFLIQSFVLGKNI